MVEMFGVMTVSRVTLYRRIKNTKDILHFMMLFYICTFTHLRDTFLLFKHILYVT